MKLTVNAKGTTVTESMEEKIEKKLSKVERYLSDDQPVHVMVQVKEGGRRHKVEVTIPMNKTVVRVEESDADMYAAIDKTEDKLERVLRKRKEKRSDRYTRPGNAVPAFEPAEENEEPEYKIVRRKSFVLEPMSEEEACEAMEAVGHSFYMFREMKTAEICVAYKREDGSYGILRGE